MEMRFFAPSEPHALIFRLLQASKSLQAMKKKEEKKKKQ